MLYYKRSIAFAFLAAIGFAVAGIAQTTGGDKPAVAPVSKQADAARELKKSKEVKNF